MAKQKGRTLLIKIGDGAETEAFTTLCALTTKTITINNEEIDVTTPDCDDPGGPMWTEVLDGTKRVSFSGNGISKGRAEEITTLNAVLSDTPIANLEVIVPNFGTFSGAFFFSSFELGGEASGGVTLNLSAASSGAVTFTAEV
ncbi:Phage major tail protein 2 [Aquimixticola soesokkakensis]|uniref:Phage major tail protein 2 n=1 Tax=Aquimixticola soesokkakensis TaxID=1519096 RepID=A0A1Y5SCM7_9RHOB|nr:phage major tail protein, TP901-1 family [Aquimixticola soesokkakensis]SLN36564.1 Phage major tail protein 2 [Aquimixticola soesokkakensis]